MALRSTVKSEETPEDIGEVLDALEKLLERTKVMYEQYFMGIQKMPPAQLHRDIERKIREFTQHQIRNTGLRFRFTTLSQKFGAYNSYWQRTMRKIEQGTYMRDIQRVKRRAERNGEEIPDEILAAMPKLMRERIKRDRERLKKRGAESESGSSDAQNQRISKAPKQRVHSLDENELADMDVNAILREMEQMSSPSKDDEPATDEMDAPSPAQVRQAETRAARAGTAPPPPPGARAHILARGTQPSPGSGVRAPAPRARPDPRRSTQPPGDPRRQSRPRPGAKPPPGMSEDEGRVLYRRYVQARKLVGERTDNLSYERLMNTLNKQAPQIMKQHKANGVQFGIVIKGDKVVLKAKPKK